MTESARTGILLLLAAASAAGYAAISRIGKLDEKIPELLGVWFFLSLVYLVSVYLTLRGGTGRRRLLLIWIGAVLFRLLLLPVEPRLSEDLYRYRWQGKLQAAGGNPYLSRPDEPRWANLRDAAYPSVNRKDLPSVYGPVLEMTYHGAYRLFSWWEPDEFRQTWLFRLPFALCDLGVGLVLMGLLTVLGMARERALVYLWNPLVIIEFWAQGHNDSFVVLAVVLALWAAARARWAWSFAALGLATMIKFWPLILFPFFLLQRVDGKWRLRWKPALAAVPVMLLAAAPYLSTLSQVTEILEGFVGGWRNNDSLYGAIWEYADRDYDRATELVQRILPVALAGLWALQLRLTRAALWAPVILLLFAANCFPWYLTWFVPLLAVHPSSGLLLWTALAPLHYQIVTRYTLLGVWEDADWVRQFEYWPVFALLAWEVGRRSLSSLAPSTQSRVNTP